MRLAGGFRVIRNSGWRARRLLILAYHGIALDDEHLWDPALFMSQAQLESRLLILQRGGYTVLPLQQALAAVADGSLPPRSITITFDDGTHDFHELAFPLLQSFEMPVTVYLTTYYCDREAPVFKLMCSYLLGRARGRTCTLRDLTGDDESFDLALPADRERAWNALVRRADREHYSGADRQGMVERLAAAVHVDLDRLMARRILQIMRPSSVQQLAAAGVDFQMHTHRHTQPLDCDLFKREIRENRVRIEQLTGKAPGHFCFPSGNYRAEFLKWLQEERVCSAVTCDPGLVTARSDLLRLPRFLDCERIPAVIFEGWIAGAADWLPQRRTYAYR